MKNALLFTFSTLMATAFPLAAYSAQAPRLTTPAIDYALEHQILFTELDGNVHPEGMVTRLEFTLAAVDTVLGKKNADTCLEEIAASQPANYHLLFSDVRRDDWFAAKLCAAMRAGLVQGNADGSFRPFATISAAEGSKIVAKAYDLVTPSLQVSRAPWYQSSLQAMSAYGAVSSSVRPSTKLMRADMAKMFYAVRSVPLPVAEWMAPTTVAPAMPVLVMPSIPTLPAMTPECSSITVRSPGMALIAQGQTLTRELDRLSHRLLREVVTYNYENGSFVTRGTNGMVHCNVISARTPGGANATQGIIVNRQITERLSNRMVQALAEARGHEAGIVIDRNVGY